MARRERSNHLANYLTELSNYGLAIFGSPEYESAEVQVIRIESTERPITCWSRRRDFNLESVVEKMGTTNGHIELRGVPRVGESSNPIRCHWLGPGSTVGTAHLDIYVGDWPSSLISINEGCYIERNRCYSAFCLRSSGLRPSLVVYDTGVVFALERRRILAVNANCPWDQVERLRVHYQSVLRLDITNIEETLNTYNDLYYDGQVRHLLNLLTEGGLLLMPSVAKVVRRGGLVRGGLFTIPSITMYTALGSEAITSLLRRSERVEGVITVGSGLDKSGSTGPPTFRWSIGGMGRTVLSRWSPKSSYFGTIYHHESREQQWVTVEVRPLTELLSVVLPPGSH